MRLLLLAGEESGVLYAARIRAEVLKLRPDAEIRGYGDSGFRIEDLAVMGIGQVLGKIFYFLRVKRTMERVIDRWRPDVVCTVDYPGMNLKLAAYAKARGIRTVHVVCPQVWAWKKGRIPKIEAAVDKLCCFLPFEPSIFKPGFAEFVGHPLVDEMARENLETGDARPKSHTRVLAILPGSRLGEIDKHMPLLARAVETLHGQIRDLRVVIPAANARAYERILSYVRGMPCITVTAGGARSVLRTADAAVVASGTATLEAALVACPTVLVYRVGWLFAAIARRVIRDIAHVGLANIIAEKTGNPCPMPELLQQAFTVENVVSAAGKWLVDDVANAKMRLDLAETMKLLRSDGDSIAKIARFLV